MPRIPATAPSALTFVAVALLLTGCAATAGTSAAESAGTASTSSAAAPAVGSAADIAFAQLMIPHHEQAIEMARLAPANSDSPQVKDLAAQIMAAQGPEIQTMIGWLGRWAAPTAMPSASATASADSGHDMGHDMGGMTSAGMMSAADMAELGQARGVEFDRMWLTMMIAHHEGAVAMADQILATTTDPQVRTMATDIRIAQAAEITKMEGLLAP